MGVLLTLTGFIGVVFTVGFYLLKKDKKGPRVLGVSGVSGVPGSPEITETTELLTPATQQDPDASCTDNADPISLEDFEPGDDVISIRNENSPEALKCYDRESITDFIKRADLVEWTGYKGEPISADAPRIIKEPILGWHFYADDAMKLLGDKNNKRFVLVKYRSDVPMGGLRSGLRASEIHGRAFDLYQFQLDGTEQKSLSPEEIV